MSRPFGFYVPYQEDDGAFGSAKGSYGRDIAKTQFIPLTAIETIYQVNGGYWRLRTLAGNTYDFGSMDDDMTPNIPAIEELIGVFDCNDNDDTTAEVLNKHLSTNSYID
jgi:hypothetical protein